MSEARDAHAEHARRAAQLDADVGAEQIASVYARALLQAAEKAAQADEVIDSFDQLMEEAIRPFPKLAEILASALISHDQKAAMLDRLFADRLPPLLLNFLKVLSRHGRLDLLATVHRQAHVWHDRLRGRIHVRLVTARPIDKPLADQLSEQLRSRLGGEPVLDCITDPNIIGGAVLRIGDTVHDGSIANQLKLIRQQVHDRIAHEIQSRRDRFRHPAGN